MEMSVFKDVEQGIPEEDGDNLQPLLPWAGERQVPARPGDLGPLDNHRHPRLPSNVSKLTIATTPSSVPSTANNSPGDTPDMMPRKWRRSDRRLRRLNTELLEAIEGHDVEEIERLLKAGANPNATCRLDFVSACHMAALTGGDALAILFKFGAEKHRLDRNGRTPLHLAAWKGNTRQMAILLNFPEDILERVGAENISPDCEEDVRKLCSKTKDLANVRCDLGEVNILLPKTWKDNIDHNCREIKGTLPLIQAGWTPLHVSASCARVNCVKLLLAAGAADPNIADAAGRTPLDVLGAGFYHNIEIDNQKFTETLKTLVEAGGMFNTMKPRGLNNINTPLHIAVELENIEAINELLACGACITCLNATGETALHLCVKRQFETGLQVLANYGQNDDPLSAMVDVKDGEGHTVLQAAVEAAWVPGVCVALEAGADVNLKANDGDTPVHSAAALGNVDVLTEILSVAKVKAAIDVQNDEGETPLAKAIIHGNEECVKAILSEGAAIKLMLPGDVSYFHLAADYGNVEILKYLMEYNPTVTTSMINTLTAGDRKGFGPIHFAVANNHVECVKFLISKHIDIRLRTTDSPHKASTPLHIAALKNHEEIAKLILDYDKTTIHEVNNNGWFPLHTAGHHGSRDVIALLLKEGADLSGYTDGPKKFRRTAIDMIINNLTKPTDFMEGVFDSYISTNQKNLQDPKSIITVDYRILMPTVCEMQQMKVIEALLKTGNRYGQKRLLVHPLVESFLYLKWKALLPFFYTMITFYAMFLVSLTIFIVSVFFYKDTEDTPPDWLSPHIWGYVVYAMTGIILLQELLYMNVKSSRYFLQMETWIKFASIGLACMLPPAVMLTTWVADAAWPRHIATSAVLLSWMEMMFLLSRFPNWGYYVLMFGKVASNVVKILLTFAFLVIGFSLSFMIQFRSQTPFEGPWAALVKTMVMMTSEFDYGALFDEEHTKELATSIIIIRIIFLIFLILAAIVLMNLMVGVAVNDINDLEILGNIRRLEKQVEFLSTLDTLVYNRVFMNILPKRVNTKIKHKRRVMCTLTLNPGKPRWRYYKILPSHLRDAILTKAQEQRKQMDDEINYKLFHTKLNEMHEAIVEKREEKEMQLKKAKDEMEEKRANFTARHDDILSRLCQLDGGMDEMKNQLATYTDGSNPIVAINEKIDKMAEEMDSIKQFLNRLESKLSNIR